MFISIIFSSPPHFDLQGSLNISVQIGMNFLILLASNDGRTSKNKMALSAAGLPRRSGP